MRVWYVGYVGLLEEYDLIRYVEPAAAEYETCTAFISEGWHWQSES